MENHHPRFGWDLLYQPRPLWTWLPLQTQLQLLITLLGWCLFPTGNSQVALVPICVLCLAHPHFNCTSLSPDSYLSP